MIRDVSDIDFNDWYVLDLENRRAIRNIITADDITGEYVIHDEELNYPIYLQSNIQFIHKDTEQYFRKLWTEHEAEGYSPHNVGEPQAVDLINYIFSI